MRFRQAHRVAAACLAAGALLAASCEIEPLAAPEPEPFAPLEGPAPPSPDPTEPPAEGGYTDASGDAGSSDHATPHAPSEDAGPGGDVAGAGDGSGGPAEVPLPDDEEVAEEPADGGAAPAPGAPPTPEGESGTSPPSTAKEPSGPTGGSTGGPTSGKGSTGGSSGSPTTTASTTAPTTTASGGSGGPSGSGMAEVDTSAIPTGSSGTGQVRLGSGAPPPPTDDIQGAIVMFCDFSHMNFDDPIVFPGVANASHLHSFFGNTGTDFASTAESIRSSGNSTCRGGILNRSAYWVPSLIDTRTGTPLRPREMVTYYTHGQVPGPEVQPHPAGLRILTGRASSSGPQNHVNWYCPNGGTYTPYISTNCRSDQYLKLSIRFPQCWNGRDLDSPDHAGHMAYSAWGRGCPSSHPIPLPQLNLNVIWDLQGQPLSALRLSSDMYPWDQPGGYSGHADWFDGWDQATKETFITECFHREVYCSAQLGNGQWLLRP